MSPAEAGALDFIEPDWRAAFEEECARKPDWPRYLQELDAFEAVLSRWRRFHHTGDEPGQRIPAPAIDGIVALAKLGILSPRSSARDVPRDGTIGYQCDEHMWLSIAGEQWRIAAIEDRMLLLEKMTFDSNQPETRQIDLNRADWSRHQEAALAILDAMR